MSRVLFLLNLILTVSVNHPTSALEETSTTEPQSESTANIDRLWLRRIIESSIDVYAPVSNTFDNDLCRSHSLLFKQGALDNTLWAVAMFDASAKIPPGLLTGNLVQLGNYDECLALHDVDSVYGKFSGQHCLVTLGDPGFLSSTNYMTRRNFGVLSLKFPTLEGHHEDILPDDGLPFSGATWSFCIPSSCRPRDLEQHLQATLSHSLGNISIRVPELGCNSWVDPAPAVTAGDVFTIILLAVLVLLVLSSTTYDLLTWGGSQRSKLLLSFSAYSNGLSVLRVSTARRADAIPAMNGVRTLACLWIIICHVHYTAMMASSLNLDVISQMGSDWQHFVIAQAAIAVDVFLLLSGALVCYYFLLERDRGIKFNIFRYYMKRYVRLTPLYAMSMLIAGTLVKHIGNVSPQSKENVQLVLDSCSSYGWLGLVYLSNYLDKEKMCISVAWSLSVDMQLFWLSPILLFAILWRPNNVKTILGSLILIGIGILFGVAYYFRNTILYSMFSVSVFSGDNIQEYFPTHVRFTPWLIGIGLGYFLYRAKKSPVTMSRCQVALGWIASASLLLMLVILGHHLEQSQPQHNPLLVAVFVAVQRPALALCVAWLIYACTTGYGGFVNTFMCWSLFEVMSKMTFAVYLVHWQLVTGHLLVAKKGTQYYNDITITIEFFGFVGISFMLGFVLMLLVEMPPINLANALLAKQSKLPEEQLLIASKHKVLKS